MKAFWVLILYMVPGLSFSGNILDLTDPENLNIADMYPQYEMMAYMNFSDTDDTEYEGHSLGPVDVSL